MVDPATTTFPRIQEGQLRMLALSSPERFPLMPEAPTVAETVPGVSFMSWLGLVMPPQAPPAIVNRLNTLVREILAIPDIQKKLATAGSTATPTTPAEMRGKVADEYNRWNKIIDFAKIERQ
jgi:tripartite-type tricarboxylate transporter receptor subunit TctC